MRWMSDAVPRHCPTHTLSNTCASYINSTMDSSNKQGVPLPQATIDRLVKVTEATRTAAQTLAMFNDSLEKILQHKPEVEHVSASMRAYFHLVLL